MYKSPQKGKYGYVQGTCTRCTESTLPLVRVKNENGAYEWVCDTCSRTLERVRQAKIKRKQVDEDDDFIRRAINE